jgi:molecular chaperone GrpE
MPKNSDENPKKNVKTSKVDTKILLQEIDALTEALQRERADAINVRRRSEEDRIKMATFYKAMVVRELLPVIDNLERALKHIPHDLQGHEYTKGIHGVVKQFEKVLADLDVERIETVGKLFDPKFHEAVSMEDGDGTREVVSEELIAGYKIGEEVIRHAMVKVKIEK